MANYLTDEEGRAVEGGVGALADQLVKASNDTPAFEIPVDPAKDDPKALLYDPFALIDQLGFRDRPSGITYQTLREMGKKTPPYLAILQTRVNQVSAFGARQKDKRKPGFRVMLRESEKHPTKQEQKRSNELENLLLTTGRPDILGRDNFKTFLRKLTRDLMDLDQACFEVVYNRKGEPAEFYALDGATIRLADVPLGAEHDISPDQVKFVQVYDEVIISEFSARELCFGVTNPRTDIRCNGYGFSSLEMLINVVTATLWSFEYNRRQFSQGSLVHGVLNFKGTVADSKIDAFRRQWKMMIQGVNNAHKTPMTNVDELQWIDFGRNNRDMEYSAWMDFLIKITAAVCQFDPSEINFNYGNSGGTGQMFGTPVAEKIQASKDRGLQPMLDDIAGWINSYIIWPIDPEFELSFEGLSARSVDQERDDAQKRSKFLMTVDELRAEEDLDPLPDGQGAIILDPTWLQNKQAADAAKQQAQQPQGMDQGGMPGQEQPQDQEAPPEEQDQGGEEPPYEFDQAFPQEEQKSLAPNELRKSRRAKVRIYDIDL